MSKNRKKYKYDLERMMFDSGVGMLKLKEAIGVSPQLWNQSYRNNYSQLTNTQKNILALEMGVCRTNLSLVILNDMRKQPFARKDAELTDYELHNLIGSSGVPLVNLVSAIGLSTSEWYMKLSHDYSKLKKRDIVIMADVLDLELNYLIDLIDRDIAIQKG